MKKILFAAVMLLAPLAMSAQAKFGHFNSTEIIPLMPEYTAAQTELQTLEKQYQEDLKRMQDELQKKSEELQKEGPKLVENIRARREQELNDLYQRYQQSYQDSQQALQKATQEKLGAITEKVMAAVKKLGEAGGYIYVVDTSTGSIPFVNTTLSTDITAQIKKEVGVQ